MPLQYFAIFGIRSLLKIIAVSGCACYKYMLLSNSPSLTFDFACRGSAACLTDPAVYQGNDSYLLLWRGKPVADPCCSCQWILIVDAINPQLIRTSRRFRHFGRWWIFATFARCARLAMGGRRNPIDSDSSNLWIPLPLRLADCGCMVTHKVCIARAALFARHMVGWRTSKCLPIIAKERFVQATETVRGDILSSKVCFDRARIQQQLPLVGDIWKTAGRGQWTSGFNPWAKGHCRRGNLLGSSWQAGYCDSLCRSQWSKDLLAA